MHGHTNIEHSYIFMKLVSHLTTEIQNMIKILGSHKELKYHANERGLYTLTKNSNDPRAKAHYVKYCGILKKAIKEAKKKKQFYDRLIAKSDNKIKTTWNIIKNETGRMHPIEQGPSSLLNTGRNTKRSIFNNFF